MEDRMLELLAKLYGEFTEFKKETTESIHGLKQDMGVMKQDIKELKQDILRIEVNHGNKLEALFDGYKQVYEKLETVEKKVDGLSDKVDRHDIKIQVIEGKRAKQV